MRDALLNVLSEILCCCTLIVVGQNYKLFQDNLDKVREPGERVLRHLSLDAAGTFFHTSCLRYDVGCFDMQLT